MHIKGKSGIWFDYIDFSDGYGRFNETCRIYNTTDNSE